MCEESVCVVWCGGLRAPVRATPNRAKYARYWRCMCVIGEFVLVCVRDARPKRADHVCGCLRIAQMPRSPVGVKRNCCAKLAL